MTEEQVKASSVAYQVGKFPFLANSRVKAIDDAEGIMKIIADDETEKVLEVHIMSYNAGELIHEVVLALQYGTASEDIACTCHAHPYHERGFGEHDSSFFEMRTLDKNCEDPPDGFMCPGGWKVLVEYYDSELPQRERNVVKLCLPESYGVLPSILEQSLNTCLFNSFSIR